MPPAAAMHGTSAPARPGPARPRFAATAALAAATALVLAGCSGQTGNARVDAVDAGGDGTLRIGLLLDNTGKQSFLNSAQLAAAKLAVQEINAAGGHKGRPVELLPEKIGEDTTSRAKELVAAKADVVIGPTDSSRAPEAIDVLSRAKVAIISPANAAHGLTRYRSGGYYFRTSAADTAQASVLVKLAKDSGARTIAIIHEDGMYGKDVSVAVAAAAKAAGLGTVAEAAFTAGQAQQAAAATKAAGPDSVILVARAGAQGAIAELNNAGLAGSKLVLSDGAIRQYGSALGSKALEGARGILPGVFPSAHFQGELVAVDPGLKDMTFAAETYDAVNLAAIAAAAAQDDAGSSVAAKLIAVSGQQGSETGEPCRSYKECGDAMRAGKRADYDGESGPIGFDFNGDVTTANYMVFTYSADNRARMSGTETAARAGG
ncbi:ABC transporter substrate-binding protein [Arthrobacter sp. NPDC058288]|uniref:ABC transporter substrate-binding protein n=1 Tax=Arthrobacter sp. NPDC058288 TaxID=3346424 RepID=UPI0036E8D6A3